MKQPKPRKVKQPPPATLRQSTRNTAEGMDGDVMMVDNPPDATTPSTATSDAGATTSTRPSTDVEMGDILPAVNPPPVLPARAGRRARAPAPRTEKDLGCHFHALVAAWTRIEAASRFEHGPTNLPSKYRPKPMSEWIAKGRGARVPTIADPAWRKKEDDGEWSVVGGYGAGGREWGPLYQWGTNSTLTLVASLYFWGCVLGDDVEFRARWEAAVMDVCWMMEGMAVYYELFKGKF
ncbi:hypothetical protein B0H13DRAFT_2375205 [Mycena leptocephala]|nr:hypothetical protein B0H13DRAFT_2375205 [Mycena leptocephala]